MQLVLVEKRLPYIVRTVTAAPSFGVELRHLRYFVTVAEHLHFGRAAKALNISQPPLSRQIRDLERCIGSQLFDRSSRGVTLTDTGVSFLGESQSILGQVTRSLSIVQREHVQSGQPRVVLVRTRPSVVIPAS